MFKSFGKLIVVAMLIPLVCGIAFIGLYVMIVGLTIPQLPAWAQGGVQDWMLDIPQDSDFYPSEFGEIVAGYSAVGWAGYSDETAGSISGVPIGDYNGRPPVGCNFGYDANYTTWEGKPVPHVGADWTISEGHQVVSVMQGQVVFAGLNDGWGNLVVIENGDYQLWYAHLLEIDVSPDQIVQNGQQVGLSGGKTPPTGNSTGAHLHHGIKVKDGETYRWIDPLQFMGADEWLDTPCR
jgi:murein DD-endopeptidase MepM/ murein hydrolase activator NlpD